MSARAAWGTLLALCGLGALAGSCSLMDLGDFELEGCKRPAQCAVLNERDELDPSEDCIVWQCRADGRGCELRAQDFDGDEQPSARVCAEQPGLRGPLDCDDEDARRGQDRDEAADGSDNDCDGFIDEGALPEPERSALASVQAPELVSVGQGDGAELVLVAGGGAGAIRAWLLADDQAADARDVHYAFAQDDRPEDPIGCHAAGLDPGQARECDFAELALAATGGELIGVGVNTRGCDAGQLRVGVASPDDFVFRASRALNVPSNVEFGVELEMVPLAQTPCTVVEGQSGARSPRVAALPAQGSGRLGGAQALALWLAASARGDCEQDSDVVALGLLPQGRAQERRLDAGHMGRAEVLGQSARCGAPALIALRGERPEDSGYVVAFPGRDRVELRWIARPDLEHASLSAIARARALPATDPSHVALAVIDTPAASASGRGLLLAFRSASAAGALGFAALGWSAQGLVLGDTLHVQRAAEITSGPAVAYAPAGFLEPDAPELGSPGGWLLLWGERDERGARLMALRVVDAVVTRALGEPFELEAQEASFPFVRQAGEQGFEYGYLTPNEQGGELRLGRIE